MSDFIEGDLKFTFPDTDLVIKYDDWSFYTKKLTDKFGGTKAVDFLYLDGDILWLIEVKDFRLKAREKEISLDDEISLKVRDSLVGLFCARNSANDAKEKEFARKSLKAKSFNIVLHIEQPDKPSKVYGKIIELSHIKLKLKQKLDLIGKVIVVNKDNLHQSIKWRVTKK